MNTSSTISKAALVQMLLSAYPNPEDETYHPPHLGPHDPIGPISQWEWVLLNPQPLPPRVLHTLSRHQAPVLGSIIARGMIERAVFQLQTAELSEGPEARAQIGERLGSMLLEEVDEYCGNVPRRLPRWWWDWKLPVPPVPDPDPGWPISPKILNALTLLRAGAEFARQAHSLQAGSLKTMLDQAADRLITTGLHRLEA